MPLTLSGYVLDYSELKISTLSPSEVSLQFGELSTESSPGDGQTTRTASSEALTHLGSVVWLNKWLEKEGMGTLLQAVPVYDPLADQPGSGSAVDSGGVIEGGEEHGQKLLLVRRCTMEMEMEGAKADGSDGRELGGGGRKIGTSTPIPIRSITQSPAFMNNTRVTPIATPVPGTPLTSAPPRRRESGLVECECLPSDIDPQKEIEVRGWIANRLLCGRKDPNELRWVSVVDPCFEEV
ncbi:hypothetical protein BDN72DRAFT_832836 [Pluteus cervinus]|uniref:Uncharacterized protein n=1 Tax=Pluteus cervinus TaxID=181527 RepID=A0ACD3B9P3_9AGAR|nr:hypothetical protein BDN72DRAFT_832836 [Pluteus cervinus]